MISNHEKPTPVPKKKEKEEEDVATSSYTLKAHVIASSPNKSCERVTGTSTPPPKKAKLHRWLFPETKRVNGMTDE